MNTLEKYKEWCNNTYFDQETRAELQSIKDNEAEIEDRFYRDLAFGTGGLRGILGNGSNRMNRYTVRKATQGLANFICNKQGQDRGVAIAYDSRIGSAEFAKETALCLAANGIKVYIYPTLSPTPQLSFTVRKLNCIAGIVITASHNPSNYNGYKVYWEDGAQITYPLDQEIIAEVNAIKDYAQAKTMKETEAKEKGLYVVIGKEMEDAYIDEMKKLVHDPERVREYAKQIKVVYSPLHGTGLVPVTRILKEIGFDQVYVVEEQEKPDGRFPTVSYPNPEDPKAFTLALNLAKNVDADVILLTDPDADRLGVYAKDRITGAYMPFTGNMSGLLICEYLLSRYQEEGKLSDQGAIVTTIVSSNMARAIANAYGVTCIETLTGFKYIGEQIKFFEQEKSYKYLFGFEESYGCLIGTYARDKDAVSAVMALCEAAAYYKAMGRTLWDQMQVIYQKYGYYVEDLHTITLKGQEGAKRIQEIMEQFRTRPIPEIAGIKVLGLRDYLLDRSLCYESQEVASTGLPKSDVLYFELEEDAWCCVRPSGTEPKIKFYMGVKATSLEDGKEQVNALKEAMNHYVI
ncbi:phospho-sugar mutase [Anaerosporobacter faecicola]|uniref:phospho-sugar mutase n=1 Tax=Anaerosporobacter faecicola TaxID=2718714 RepID=UPI00143B11E8|nr:phospho-sugar mutase [Anaerosporobacter faecicola]